MNRTARVLLMVFLAWGAATTAVGQNPPKSDSGIVGPSMTPTPTIQQRPETPVAGDGSVRNVELPAVITYEAMLQKVRGTLPTRLGAWACAKDICTLKAAGDASAALAVDACKSFQQVAKENGLRYRLSKFRFNTTSLTETELSACTT